jgi:hypothetical protein
MDMTNLHRSPPMNQSKTDLGIVNESQLLRFGIIALLLPFRRKPTDAERHRLRENSAFLFFSEWVPRPVMLLQRGAIRRWCGRGVPPRTAQSRNQRHRYSEATHSTEDFEKASVQGSSAVR